MNNKVNTLVLLLSDRERTEPSDWNHNKIQSSAVQFRMGLCSAAAAARHSEDGLTGNRSCQLTNCLPYKVLSKAAIDNNNAN